MSTEDFTYGDSNAMPLDFLRYELYDVQTPQELKPHLDATVALRQYTGETKLFPAQDTLGIILDGTLFALAHHQTQQESSFLEPQDISVLKKNAHYTFHGSGTSLDIIMNNLWGGRSFIRAKDTPFIGGYAGGTIKMLKNDTGQGNIHLIWVDAEKNIKKPHYHKELTEIYVVLQGTGIMQLQSQDQTQNTVFPLQPGTLVLVPPHTIHNTCSDKGMVIQVIGLPRFSKKDMYWV